MLLYVIAVAWVVFGFLSFGIVGFNYLLARRAAKKTWKIRKDESYMPRVSIIVPTYNESEVIKYERWQLRRLSVKPGITCTWQATANRHSINFERWMKMDLKYIDNWSFFEDVKLVFKTFFTFFLATGH